MILEFVHETSERRGINRNNYRAIQRRATQVAAKTRRSKKLLSSQHQIQPNDPVPACRTDTEDRDDTREIPIPTMLYPPISSLDPFLSKFGRAGHALLMQASEPSLFDGYCCQSSYLKDSRWSVLQMGVLLDLSPATSLHDAERMFKIVKLTQSKFLEHIPGRYGCNYVLDAAIECVLSRCDIVVAPYQQRSDARTSRHKLLSRSRFLYAHSLRKFREALDSASLHDLTDLWFASLLLMLYELLDDSTVPGWTWHSVGAAQLLQKLGPTGLVTSFHRSLLASHSRTMIIEAFTQQSHCFLDEPTWQSAIRDTTLPEQILGDRSLVATELWLLNAKVTNVFRRAEDCIAGNTATRRQLVLDDIKRLLADYEDWQQRWGIVLGGFTQDDGTDANIRFQAAGLLGVHLCFCVILMRLLSAVDPINSHISENTVLDRCDRIYQLRMEYVVSASRLPDHGSFFGNVAIATFSTTDEWYRQVVHSIPGECIGSAVFEKWCSILRRGL